MSSKAFVLRYLKLTSSYRSIINWTSRTVDFSRSSTSLAWTSTYYSRAEQNRSAHSGTQNDSIGSLFSHSCNTRASECSCGRTVRIFVIRKKCKELAQTVLDLQFFAFLLFQAEQTVVEEVNNDDGDDDWSRNESRMCFSPDYNNVLFASALDGWAFGYINTVDHFTYIPSFLIESIISQIYMPKSCRWNGKR